MSEKTEEPTPRKLERARRDGEAAVSSALVQGAGFIVAVALTPAAVAAAATRLGAALEVAIDHPEAPMSPLAMTLEVLAITLPLVAAAGIAAIAFGLVQTGGAFTFKKLAPDLSRANPFTGIKQLFSWQRWLGVLRSLVAALVVGWLAVRLLLDHGADLAHAAGNAAAAPVIAASLTKKLAWIAALVGLSLAGADVVVTRLAWRRRHKMSKDEVKREHKEAEGDPEIKAARQRAHQEMLASATLAAVRQATVVVVNPTHLAVALRYLEDEDESPRVVAQGAGDLARKMLDAARAYNVPVVRDVPVARALSELAVGDEIPEELYEAVAEILREAWDASAAEAES